MHSLDTLYRVVDIIEILNDKKTDLSDCSVSIYDLMQKLFIQSTSEVENSKDMLLQQHIVDLLDPKLDLLSKILLSDCTIDKKFFVESRKEMRIKFPQSVERRSLFYKPSEPVEERSLFYKPSEPVKGSSPFSSFPLELIVKILEQSGETLRVFKTCSLVSTSFKAVLDGDSFWSNLCNKEIPNLLKIKDATVKLKDYYKDTVDVTQFLGDDEINLCYDNLFELPIKLNINHILIRTMHLKKLALSQYPYPSIVSKLFDNTILFRSARMLADEDFVNMLTTARGGEPYCMTRDTRIHVIKTRLPNLQNETIERLSNHFFRGLDKVWIKLPDGKKYSIGLDTTAKNLTVDRFKQILEDQHKNLQGQLNDYELVRAGVVGKGPDLVNNLGTNSMYLLNGEELQLIKNDTAMNLDNNINDATFQDKVTSTGKRVLEEDEAPPSKKIKLSSTTTSTEESKKY